MKPCYLIVNPKAGGGRGALMATRAEAHLQRAGVPCQRVDTQKPGDGERLARALQPENFHRLIVVGGDGTINEVVRGLKTPGIPLAVIPAGSGNDFARLLGIRGEEHALETALHGIQRRIDLGMSSFGSFVNIFSFGFDAAIATRANQWKNRLPAWLLYPAALVMTLFSFKPLTMHITTESAQGLRKEVTGSYLLMAVCNGSHYGGGMQINPQADPFDGRLELCLIREMPGWKILFLFPTVYRGKHLRFSEVTIEKVVRVSFSSEAPGLVNQDGETWPERQGEVWIQGKGLEVMSPVLIENTERE